MNSMIGAVFLIAGTAIGAGMIALPIALAKLGFFFSTLLMVTIWFLIFYTALVGIELNLRAQNPLALGALGKKISGPIAQIIGSFGLSVLCFALLAAYINGSGSILVYILQFFGIVLDTQLCMKMIGGMLFCFLFQGIKIADYINRIFFAFMILGALLLIGCLAPFISFDSVPQNPSELWELKSWTQGLPVLFTSFGFHVIFHTISSFLNMNKDDLKKAFFWGSLIPTVLYTTWTGCTLFFLFCHNRDFYNSMITSSVSVGQLIAALTVSAKNPFIQVILWSVSLLAILTSILGVGIGLGEQFEHICSQKIKNHFLQRFCISIITLLPPLGIALWIPEAFIKALGFAGMILVVIAIFLPMWLLYQSDRMLDSRPSYYPILDQKFLRIFVLFLGCLIFAAEVINMLV